jgi:general secretion pathway protein F
MGLRALISLEQLVALNDEIAALSRAGVPLPQGLRELGKDLPGSLGKISTSLGDRLEAGMSLDKAVGHSAEQFEPLYAAVIRAGLRSGRLPAALESLSATIRRIADIRRTAMAAMLYPLILLIVASVLLAFMVMVPLPVVSISYDRFGIVRPEWYQLLLRTSQLVVRGMPWLWIALVCVIAWGAYRSSRVTSYGVRTWLWLPPLGSVLRAGGAATFAELLAILLEHGTPLHEAVDLAAAASGDQQLRQGAAMLADQIRRGDATRQVPPGIPPLLGWLIVGHLREDRLVASLRRLASSYRKRVARWGDWLSVYFPIFVSAAVGGVVTLYCALLVFAPFYHLLYQLGGNWR